MGSGGTITTRITNASHVHSFSPSPYIPIPFLSPYACPPQFTLAGKWYQSSYSQEKNLIFAHVIPILITLGGPILSLRMQSFFMILPQENYSCVHHAHCAHLSRLESLILDTFLQNIFLIIVSSCWYCTSLRCSIIPHDRRICISSTPHLHARTTLNDDSADILAAHYADAATASPDGFVLLISSPCLFALWPLFLFVQNYVASSLITFSDCAGDLGKPTLILPDAPCDEPPCLLVSNDFQFLSTT